MRVLDRHQRGRRKDDVPRRLERGAQIRRGEQPAASDHGELHAGIRRRGPELVPDDVRLVAHHHIVAGTGQQLEADLVRHRAAGHEERRLLAEQRGDAFLQRAHRRVLAVLVVAHRRMRHRRAHRIGGQRHRV